MVTAPVVKLRPKSTRTRWVAIDLNNKIISEGQTADSARKKALKKTDAEFLVAFVPKEGTSYIL